MCDWMSTSCQWRPAKQCLPFKTPKRFPDEFAVTEIYDGHWSVTHLPTGHKVNQHYHRDPQSAMKDAQKRLRKIGVDKFRKAVKKVSAHIGAVTKAVEGSL